MDVGADGTLTVLREGTNGWTCMPSVPRLPQPTSAPEQMGMQWFMDIMAQKPKPTNTAAGLISIFNGAVQRGYTDPFDRTSPLIPIGPHWMLMWPFTAEHTGLSTVMHNFAGSVVVFAGTPYAHLHICGGPVGGQQIRARHRRGVDHGVQVVDTAHPTAFTPITGGTRTRFVLPIEPGLTAAARLMLLPTSST